MIASILVTYEDPDWSVYDFERQLTVVMKEARQKIEEGKSIGNDYDTDTWMAELLEEKVSLLLHKKVDAKKIVQEARRAVMLKLAVKKRYMAPYAATLHFTAGILFSQMMFDSLRRYDLKMMDILLQDPALPAMKSSKSY